MTVNIIETIGGSVVAFGTGTPAVTTTLVSTDRVVVVVSKSGTAGTPTVSGLGGTWVADVANTGTLDLYILSTSGVTGTGTVTINGWSNGGDYVLYVLRSDVSNSVVFVNGAGNNVSAAGVGATLSVTSGATSAGSMHLAAGYVTNGTIALPHSSSSPNSGFTTDRTVGIASLFIHRSVPADETISLVMGSSGVYNGAMGRANYYDNHVPTPPASGFTGWGVPIF